MLQKLSAGEPIGEIILELRTLEQSKSITDRLLEAFPGYFGRFITMHYAQFLNEPIQTDSQQKAYEEIINFFDSMQNFDIPENLREYLMEGTKDIGTSQISSILEANSKAYNNPEDFLRENKETLEQYLEYKKSVEYKESPGYKLMEITKEFYRTNGYYDIFIPAMKELSPSYAKYYEQMEIANNKLLEEYPEIEKLVD